MLEGRERGKLTTIELRPRMMLLPVCLYRPGRLLCLGLIDCEEGRVPTERKASAVLTSLSSPRYCCHDKDPKDLIAPVADVSATGGSEPAKSVKLSGGS